MPVISTERFLSLRKLYSLTQEEMGKRLGIGAKYLGMIERGDKAVEEDSSLGLLFRVLEGEVTPRLGGPASNPASSSEPVSGVRLIPVIGWAHAGDAAAYEQLPDSWVTMVPTECRDERAFGVRLEGDSMEPTFKDGDLLVVMPSEEVYSGCFVVARFANDGVVFRRLETAGDRIRLVPLNERYPVTDHAKEEFSWMYPVWGRWTQLWKR